MGIKVKNKMIKVLRGHKAKNWYNIYFPCTDNLLNKESIMEIKKVVIPVAGKGTRFLPITKEIPKEMIPLLNRPMVDYAVSEAIDSGIDEIIFVTSEGKESIQKYFQTNSRLEEFLEENGKTEQLNLIRKIGKDIKIQTVEQKEQLGLGHAILCAKELINDELFAIILADDLVLGEEPVTKQLIEVSKKYNNSSVIGVMKIPSEDTVKYGVINGEYVDGETTLKMSKMVEKPKPENAPSNLATPGRYILSRDIFSILEEIPRGAGGEYQLTDAINILASRKNVYANIFIGERYDTGNVESYLNATVEFALHSKEYSTVMKKIIKEKMVKYNL